MNNRIKVLYIQVHGGGGSLVALYEMLKRIDLQIIEPIVLCYYNKWYKNILPACRLRC